ncbi:lamin tail domain-containing protein [Candidatus Parcubacteria bacterium]|nr:lamin tail domain-containing protein [Candidatus Parcubacteria bacterium]
MFTRISLIIAIALPLSASAQVEFSEVMYDLETGGDSGREWVEIRNSGSSAIDVSDYRFREAETNHALTLSQGDAMLAAGGVAIIADNPAKFLTDNPSFSGTIFDSSFSLSNTGETLVLKDTALLDIDQFTYSSEMGAAGDGKSLQKSEGSWIAALPTPGSALSSSSAGSSSSSTESSSADTSTETSSTTPSVTQSSAPVSGSSSKWPTKPQIYSYAGDDRAVTVGTPEEFIGEALGIDKKPLQNARYLWNFGDGAYAEGKHVLHTYHYPGSYVATLDVSSGEFSNSDKLIVTVATADLSLRSGRDSLGGYLEIENRGSEEVDLSYWQFLSGGKLYTLPKDSFLLAKKSVRFPEGVTSLPFTPSAELRYPNGTPALTSTAEGIISVVPTPAPSSVVVSSVATQRSAPKISPEAPTRVSVPERSSPVVAAVAAASLPTTTAASSHLGEYKWFYLLGALLGSTLLGVFWLGRAGRQEIEGLY